MSMAEPLDRIQHMSELVERIAAVVGEAERLAKEAPCSCGGPVCTPELGWYHFDEAFAQLESRSAARFVVAFGPAVALRHVEHARKVLARHVPDELTEITCQCETGNCDLGCSEYGERSIIPCRGCSIVAEDYWYLAYDKCPEIRDLASAWGVS